MAERADRFPAAIGFTVKSGWAAAVLLEGPPASPRVLDARRIDLSDPAISESRQPYHASFGTERPAGPELSRLLGSVRRFGKQAVGGLIGEYAASGRDLVGVGVVVGSLTDPESITNAHIRIHAREGHLFRSIVEDGAVGGGLACSVWRERDLYDVAARTLKRPVHRVRDTVKLLGFGAAGPWRAEQKAAAIAAWIVLAASAAGLSRTGSFHHRAE